MYCDVRMYILDRFFLLSTMPHRVVVTIVSDVILPLRPDYNMYKLCCSLYSYIKEYFKVILLTFCMQNIVGGTERGGNM